MNKIQYSSEIFLLASSIYFKFPGCYKFLRELGILTLPSHYHLSRLTSDVKCETGINPLQIQYLKKKFNNLGDWEKNVNILFDEIHINPKVQYQAGKLVGLTEKKEVATKIQAFMISSPL